MIEEMRIKCPSCGIVLDVRNSRHEAVKKIVCPNCKKQLAIDFQEQEKPTPAPLGALYYDQLRIDLHEGINRISIPDCEHLELNVVRLSDGGSKCLVRPLSTDHPVLLNGQAMEEEDQEVLAMGDELKTGNTTLTYGQPKEIQSHAQEKKEEVKKEEKAKQEVKSRKVKKDFRFPAWLIGGAALIVALVCVILLWPKSNKTIIDGNEEKEKMETRIDTPIVMPPHPERTKPGRPRAITEPTQTTQPTEKTVSISDLSDNELEVLASQNDVEAQYILGMRLAKRSGATNVKNGIKLLRSASANGSSKAQDALRKIYLRLEELASEGDETAGSILNELYR